MEKKLYLPFKQKANAGLIISSLFVLLLFPFQEIYAKTSKFRISWRDNPSTTMVIGWVQESGSSPMVHYGTTDQGTNHLQYSNTKAPDRSVSDKGLNHRFARLTGLKPNTAYYFLIRDSDGNSKRFWFKTAPDNPNERLSIIAGGDSRNNAVPRRNANSMVAKLRPHAVMFGGDMTDTSSDSQWQEWLDDWQLTTGADGRMIPIIAERGNHDRNSDMVNLFDVPDPNVHYALNLGGSLLRIYT
ncbi:MAG: metallophosphoesterase family protein, partial [Bacteroidetes bacterium]|nr:metallophosphoesterase family protein [Bacteroidota bacterium]